MSNRELFQYVTDEKGHYVFLILDCMFLGASASLSSATGLTKQIFFSGGKTQQICFFFLSIKAGLAQSLLLHHGNIYEIFINVIDGLRRGSDCSETALGLKSPDFQLVLLRDFSSPAGLWGSR